MSQTGDSVPKCRVYLTIAMAISVCALVWAERFGVDRWTIISRPTLTADLAAVFIGFGATVAFFFCSLSSNSNDMAFKKISLRKTALRDSILRTPAWELLIFLATAFIALAYIRLASEYLPGIDNSEIGRVSAVTNSTRWQSPCARSLDVELDRGVLLHFCEVTAWGRSIGPINVAPGDRVLIKSRNTRFFDDVKSISIDFDE